MLNYLAVIFLIYFQINTDLITSIENRRDYTLETTENSNKDYSIEVLNREILFLKEGSNYNYKINLIPKNVIDSTFYYINEAHHLFYNDLSEFEANSSYLKAIETSLRTKNKAIICHTIRSKLWYHLWYFNNYYLDNDTLIELYKENVYSEKERAIYNFFYALIKLRESRYKKHNAGLINFDILPDFYGAWWLNHLAIYYYYNKDYKKSNQLYHESIQKLDKNEAFIFKLRKSGIYLNMTKDNIETRNYNNAISSLNKAKINDYKNKLYLHNQTYFYSYKSKLLENEKKWDSAYYYLKSFNKRMSDLNQNRNLLNVQALNKKYQTAEKEKQIIIEQQKKKQNRNIAYGLAGSLALGSIIAFLIFKNVKRKQKLREQAKTLENRELSIALKEQEFKAIDAMIEGQEQERQRIANDLHDDLGGLMATVKLHFNALKEQKSEHLFDKTNKLLDEAYQKVRTIAHAKNLGVIANQGLLKAVKLMAEKISVSNKITIEVIDFGLSNRLENSLELTVFRIIQELTTNIIKHAKATEACIHLTNHEDSINILVEDNGIGFNPNKIKKGMGITNIDKRIAHLDGTLTIESEENQGTTIIIDIPL